MTDRRTQSGIPLRPFYGPAPDHEARYVERPSDPGAYPVTRGRLPRPHRRDTWIHQVGYDPLGPTEPPC